MTAERLTGTARAERLERRRMLSVAVGPDGWTVITPPADARVVYVSSSTGNDASDGAGPASPVRSLARGASILRDGSGDQLLLRCGDTWHEAFGKWTRSGRSADEPLLIGQYGAGPRPVVATGTGTAFMAGSAGGSPVHDVALIGIDFWADGRDPSIPGYQADGVPNGIVLRDNVAGVLIEDCVVRDYGVNIDAQRNAGSVSDVSIRRSVVIDAYVTGGTAQGLYADGVHHLTLDGNVFDHNGWAGGVTGAAGSAFSHDAYITAHCDGFAALGNVFANASGHGLQARAGGTVEDNVFLDNPTGLSFGLVNGSPVKAGGVTGVVNGNVFLGHRASNGTVRGAGIEVSNTRPGGSTIVSNNIFADAPDAEDSAIRLAVGHDIENPQEMAGLNDLLVTGNIVYNWVTGLFMPKKMLPGWNGGWSVNRVMVRGNDFQQLGRNPVVDHGTRVYPAAEAWSGNRYQPPAGRGSPFRVIDADLSFAQWQALYEPDARAIAVPYADPARSGSSYGAALAAAGLSGDFLAAARGQSRQDWHDEYTAGALIGYVRQGFEEVGSGPRDWRPVTPPRVSADVPYALQAFRKQRLMFTVHYSDDEGVSAGSIDARDVSLSGPRGKSLSARTVVTQPGPGGDGFDATYTFMAPRKKWRKADEGLYHLSLTAGEVMDATGAAVWAVPLGDFHLVRKPPLPQPAALEVQQFTFATAAPQSLSLRFNIDIGDTAAYNDLVLTRLEDGATVDPAKFAEIYDPATFTATWRFPGYPAGSLPAGSYRVSVSSKHIHDYERVWLDGNGDGLGGDDYAVSETYVISQ